MRLVGRMLDIAEGRSGLPADKVSAYVAMWTEQGYEMPPYPHIGLGDTIHTVLERTGIAWLVRRVLPQCQCQKRRAWLNRWFSYPLHRSLIATVRHVVVQVVHPRYVAVRQRLTIAKR